MKVAPTWQVPLVSVMMKITNKKLHSCNSVTNKIELVRHVWACRTAKKKLVGKLKGKNLF
jgi:hypothetical protein